MPKLATPLTDTAVRNAKPKDKTYTLGDGDGMYLEITPNGSKFWRMAYRQENGKPNRLTFGKYPEVTVAEARNKRLAARKLLDQGTDPARAKREEKQSKAIAAVHTFEAVARAWLAKTAADRASSTQIRTPHGLRGTSFRLSVPSLFQLSSPKTCSPRCA
nr:Arm DNA-binding domain-containing protein [Massilia sp. JS1662]